MGGSDRDRETERQESSAPFMDLSQLPNSKKLPSFPVGPPAKEHTCSLWVSKVHSRSELQKNLPSGNPQEA